MNILKTLESIGETNSLNQFESVEDLLLESKVNISLLSKIKTKKIDLVCMIFPEQDEPEDDSEEPEDDSDEINY